MARWELGGEGNGGWGMGWREYASSLRTRNYVLERLMSESKEADSDATRVRALELLGKTVSLFNDTIEIKETRDSNDIEAEIEEKIVALLSKEEAE